MFQRQATGNLTMAKRSVIVAYLLWAIGGWCGLHHFYLKRHAQAILWCDTHVPCPSPGPVLPGDAPKNPPS